MNMEEEGMEGREHGCEQSLGGICLSEDVTKKSIVLQLIKKLKRKYVFISPYLLIQQGLAVTQVLQY